MSQCQSTLVPDCRKYVASLMLKVPKIQHYLKAFRLVVFEFISLTLKFKNYEASPLL